MINDAIQLSTGFAEFLHFYFDLKHKVMLFFNLEKATTKMCYYKTIFSLFVT